MNRWKYLCWACNFTFLVAAVVPSPLSTAACSLPFPAFCWQHQPARPQCPPEERPALECKPPLPIFCIQMLPAATLASGSLFPAHLRLCTICELLKTFCRAKIRNRFDRKIAFLKTGCSSLESIQHETEQTSWCPNSGEGEVRAGIMSHNKWCDHVHPTQPATWGAELNCCTLPQNRAGALE